jgi:signal peptidase I
MGSFIAHFYFSPIGRTGRKLYWICGILPMLCVAAASAALAVYLRISLADFNAMTAMLVPFAMWWIWVALVSRRLQDLGLSAWWVIAVVSLPGIFEFFVQRAAELPALAEVVILGVLPGTKGQNRFGPEPTSAEFTGRSRPAPHPLFTPTAIVLFCSAAALYALNPLHAATDSLTARFTGIDMLRQSSVAMEPSVRMNERVFSSTWTFRFREPVRGDLVVFQYPRDPRVDYLKRIVALPGDTFELRDCRVVVNDTHPDEPYLDPGSGTSDATCKFGPEKVPPGMYAVLNDNRFIDIDSRTWGYVPRANILGKVLGH